jgi:hypothetical protein
MQGGLKVDPVPSHLTSNTHVAVEHLQIGCAKELAGAVVDAWLDVSHAASAGPGISEFARIPHRRGPGVYEVDVTTHAPRRERLIEAPSPDAQGFGVLA